MKPVVALALMVVFMGMPAGSSDGSADFDGLDPHIYSVVTGYWEQGERRFDIRVIVANYGSEHVSSKIHIQWLEYSDRGMKLAASAVVIEISSGFWSAGIDSITGAPSEAVISVSATNTFTLEEALFTIRLVGIGEYEVDRSEAGAA